MIFENCLYDPNCWKVYRTEAAKGCPEENCMGSVTLMVTPCTLPVKWLHEAPGESLTGTAVCVPTGCQLGSRKPEQATGYATALSLLCPPMVPHQITFSLILSRIISMFMNQAHFSGNRIVYIHTETPCDEMLF